MSSSEKKSNALSATSKHHSFSYGSPQKKVPLSSLKKKPVTSQSMSRLSNDSPKNPISRVSCEDFNTEENIDDIKEMLRRRELPRPKKSVSQVELPSVFS